MDGSKPWYASTGIWGSVATMIVGLAGLFHFHPDAQWNGDLASWLVSLGPILTGAIALYGRLRATKQIGGQGSGVRGQIIAMTLALTAVMGLGGCQAAGSGSATTQPAQGGIDPTTVLTMANQSLTTAQTILADLHVAGFISQGDWQNVVNAEATIGSALNAWQANLGQPAATQWQSVFDATLPNLLSAIQTAEKMKAAAPATTPVPSTIGPPAPSGS